MKNYLILFAAVAALSFNVCYLASHSGAQGVCTHRGQVCNFSISTSLQCVNGVHSTSIHVVGEEYGANARLTGGPCGLVYNKWLGFITTKTDLTCGLAGDALCY